MINKKYLEKFKEAYKDVPVLYKPISFMSDSEYYHQEEWKFVSPMYVPDVLPEMYKVSTFGNVYTYMKSPIYPNGGLMKHSINSKGYHQINLMSVNGKKIGIKITKLVKLHFDFIRGCEAMEVDHIDGNKDNNCLWNLDWVTPQENTHRAIINNQRDLSCTIESGTLLTDNEARCLFMESLNNNFEDLSLKYNVSIDYIKGLHSGAIRPYLKLEYLNNGYV